MPSIELDGHSEAAFALVDGKIVRIPASQPATPQMPSHAFETRGRPGGRE
ncbi:MAG TPA: hypothetical protein VM370_08235 [Candidatus Thermoplasmatota archaeon]|nr:hypothetical protein [Candidatus Thermoplasmatota archaeon]